MILDGKKQYAIKHWFEFTCEEAHEEVRISLRDGAFQFGPFGEQLSMYKFLFLESTAGLSALPTGEMMPVAGEPTVSINWALPMDSVSQKVLFTRIRKTFERATAIIDQPSDRKKYRMNEDDLYNIRNLICIWTQIRSFCSSRTSHFAALDNAIGLNNSKDHELQAILDARPQQFGISMLLCAQKEAIDKVRVQEEGAIMEVEKEHLAVRDARWGFFNKALQRDQEKLKMVQEAPTKLQALKHRKHVAWRLEQAKIGEKVVKSYCEKFLRCDLVIKQELAQQKINEYRSYVVSCLKLNVGMG